MVTVKRLEAGWLQRIAWSVLVWGSLGLLAWVPFLYVAIRRGRGSDWGAFCSFVLYELITIPWLSLSNDDGDAILGSVIVLTLLIGTIMLLFAEFDSPLPRQQPYGAMPMPGPQPGQPYGQGYPYAR
ncbi:hypothetical protein ACH4ZX_30330 [Streptomyces sp. NPDC020490]|uniref:hypothetical protein n=1 Tax=Streptomyces sp. NPDC020490 TaxID=3365078 RepID=UPI0037B8B371